MKISLQKPQTNIISKFNKAIQQSTSMQREKVGIVNMFNKDNNLIRNKKAVK